MVFRLPWETRFSEMCSLVWDYLSTWGTWEHKSSIHKSYKLFVWNHTRKVKYMRLQNLLLTRANETLLSKNATEWGSSGLREVSRMYFQKDLGEYWFIMLVCDVSFVAPVLNQNVAKSGHPYVLAKMTTAGVCGKLILIQRNLGPFLLVLSWVNVHMRLRSAGIFKLGDNIVFIVLFVTVKQDRIWAHFFLSLSLSRVI